MAAPRADDLVLVVNSGSSSLKFGVYRRGQDDEEALLTGNAENIGRSNGNLRIKFSGGATVLDRQSVFKSQLAALTAVSNEISKHIQATPSVVGHRIVHGGPRLVEHQKITPEVLNELRAVTHFAPLHIPEALSLIVSAQKLFPAATQFACFDDAFHRTLPEVASRLPIPARYFEAGIRRYGFHGISYESLVHHFGSRLPERAIFAHLGNGASLCAVRNGVSIDTTMGLTPTGGVPMGTRSGDLDPGVIIHLLRSEKLTADELEDLVNHHCGLLALSSGESDVKNLQARADSGDENAALALDAFAVSIRKVIGSYVALLGGVELLVFSGGIGEHSERIRREATKGLEIIGVTPQKIQVIPTEEEMQIARHCRRMMQA
jgi:acetate kinase